MSVLKKKSQYSDIKRTHCTRIIILWAFASVYKLFAGSEESPEHPGWGSCRVGWKSYRIKTKLCHILAGITLPSTPSKDLTVRDLRIEDDTYDYVHSFAVPVGAANT